MAKSAVAPHSRFGVTMVSPRPEAAFLRADSSRDLALAFVTDDLSLDSEDRSLLMAALKKSGMGREQNFPWARRSSEGRLLAG